LFTKTRKWILASVIALMVLNLPTAQAQDDLDATVKEANAQSAKATKVFEEIMKTPDSAIPRDLLEHARAVAVFPHVIKAAFVIINASRLVPNSQWTYRLKIWDCWRITAYPSVTFRETRRRVLHIPIFRNGIPPTPTSHISFTLSLRKA
jgi:hypothetical protein